MDADSLLSQLLKAVGSGDSKLAEIALKDGADPKKASGYLLHTAWGFEDYDFFKRLLECGADPNVECWAGISIFNSIFEGNLKRDLQYAQALIDYGGDVKPLLPKYKTYQDFLTPEIKEAIEKEDLEFLHQKISRLYLDERGRGRIGSKFLFLTILERYQDSLKNSTL